jgi:hypothetical protein
MRVTAQTIDRWLHNGQLKKRFPRLNNPPRLKPAKQGCNGCDSKPQPGKVDVNELKLWVARLGPERAKVLKDIIGVDKLQIRFKARNGITRDVEI